MIFSLYKMNAHFNSLLAILAKIAGWFFGSVFLLYALGAFTRGEPIPALLALILTVFSIPSLNRRLTSLIKNQTGKELKGKSRVAVVTAIFFLFFLAIPTKTDVKDVVKDAQPQATKSASPIINTLVTKPSPVQETPAATQVAPLISVSPSSLQTPTPTPKNFVTAKPTSRPTVTIAATVKPTPAPTDLDPIMPPLPVGKYTCDCSKTCEKISSCSEAQYLLNSCDCRQRDADKDGIACDKAPLYCE